MVNLEQRGLSLLLKLGRSLLRDEQKDNSEEQTKPKEEFDPMVLFWESAKFDLDKKHEPYLDSYVDDVGLDTIPNTTDETVAEYKYDFESLNRVYLPEAVENFDVTTGKVEDFLLSIS